MPDEDVTTEQVPEHDSKSTPDVSAAFAATGVAGSEALYSQTLEIKQRMLGPENLATALTRYNMG